MLSHWKEAATDSIISALERNDLSSADKLRKLIQLATGDGNVPYGSALVEAAIRYWGRYNSEVAETVGVVDAGRLNYLSRLFAQRSKSETDAQRHAAIPFGTLIGLERLSHTGLTDLRDDLDALLETLLMEHRETKYCFFSSYCSVSTNRSQADLRGGLETR